MILLSLLTALAATCPEGSILEDAIVRVGGFSVDHTRLTDGQRALEGSVWNAPRAVVLPQGSGVTWVLDEPTRLTTLLLQADGNDAYVIEVSSDGESYRTLWDREPIGEGLLTRTREGLEAEISYVRLRAKRGGDGQSSVAELQAYCEPPQPWPPEITTPEARAEDKRDRARERTRELAWLKGLFGAFGGALLVAAGVARRSRPRWVRWLCAALIVASFYVWTNQWTFHRGRDVHLHDTFHYLLGARYFDELGHDELYRCALQVEAESPDGGDVSAGRLVRRLSDNRIVRGADELGGTCAHLFSPARWGQFTRDVLFFRQQLGPDDFGHALRDHGYNATPAWSLVAEPLAGDDPPTIDALRRYSQLGLLTYVAFFAVLIWGFGWEAAALAAVVWAAGYPWAWYWTGGSFGRAWWLLAAGAGLASWKRGHATAGGALLGVAAMLRGWPALLLVGPALAAVVRQDRSAVRWVAGVALSVALLGGGAMARFGGDTWARFAANARVHASTPLTNHMGMEAVLWWDAETSAERQFDGDAADPFLDWKATRQRTIQDRSPVGIATGALLLGLTGWSVLRMRREWERASASILVVVTLLLLTSYDYVMLTLLAPLASRTPRMTAVLAMTAASTQVAHLSSGWFDAQHTMASLFVLAGVVAIVALSGSAATQLETEGVEPAQDL